MGGLKKDEWHNEFHRELRPEWDSYRNWRGQLDAASVALIIQIKMLFLIAVLCLYSKLQKCIVVK